MIMAQIVRKEDGVSLVVNPGEGNELVLDMPVNTSRVMGEEDQERYPWEVIIQVVPRPRGGTWRGYPKDRWPLPAPDSGTPSPEETA